MAVSRSDAKLDLRGTRDAHRVPASYRSLIAGGWVHYFDWHYGARHFKAQPLTFGTLQSRLFTALELEQHEAVDLNPEELRALNAWIDLNCPLWPDYRPRSYGGADRDRVACPLSDTDPTHCQRTRTSRQSGASRRCSRVGPPPRG